MSPEDFSNLAQGIAALANSAALLLGGAWAYWKFVWQREREPRAEFDVAAEFLGIQDGKWLVEVSARLANKGRVRHLMKNGTMNIRYITKDDRVVESQVEGHFSQVSFPHGTGRRKVWWDSYIDPGLEFRNSYLTWVPVEATFVLLLCKFEYDKGVWPAQRAFKVPNQDGLASRSDALKPASDAGSATKRLGVGEVKIWDKTANPAPAADG